tara:strand:+ start:2454 stop:3902 length:1449 start_codon:yes stop_codon:yes gene_type:complete
MEKNKFAIRFLNTLEKVENFYKFINRKLNSNKLSNLLENLFKKNLQTSKLLNINKISNRLKSLLTKKIQIPTWLEADSFSKGIRLFIKGKFGVTSKVNRIKTKIKSQNPKSNISRNYLLSIKDNFQIIPKITNRFFESIASSQTKIYQSLYERFQRINTFNNKIKRRKSIKVDNRSQTLAIAFYSDHYLTLANVSINPKNQILVRGVVEVPIPGHIIGDSLVEDKNELANIILDLFNLLKLDKSPLLLILSSSFFKVNTFFSSELKQISNTDYKVQSKSPYLPEDTFVEFHKMKKEESKNKLIRTIYSRRKLIESWTDMLEIVNVPIIGLTPSSPNVFDLLTIKMSEALTILIDIEITSTTVLIGKRSADLTTHKLPYGCSLYISDNDDDLSNNFFTRVLASIELIMAEYNDKSPESIFVVGQGLDNLIKGNRPLPNRFRRVSEINLSDYSYLPSKMEIHEIASKSIDSTIETLACIASSCL